MRYFSFFLISLTTTCLGCDRRDVVEGRKAQANEDVSVGEAKPNTTAESHQAQKRGASQASPVLAAPLPTEDPGAGATQREPYFQRGDAVSKTDDFWFWGWSEDERHYAFETYYYGPGATNCEGTAALTIVDAAIDRVAAGGHLSFSFDRPEADECGETPKQKLAAVRQAALDKYQIKTGYFSAPSRLLAEDGAYTTRASDGTVFSFQFDVRHKSEPYQKQGAAYRLAWLRPGNNPIVLEPGTRRRDYVMSYSLDTAMLFVSPRSRSAALFVGMVLSDYEGTRKTWMSNGFSVTPR